MHMAFHRVGSDVELLSNFFVAQTVCNKYDDFALRFVIRTALVIFPFPVLRANSAT
jgi:hypothetical protein